tara:strand:+ start:90 stop:854 length:765 start_codon:yes stop_codon:yes gene_type:complete
MPWAQERLKNYLTENIRDVVRSEVLDPVKSKGKLYGKPRIFNDLLSSQPLCFNLFGELSQDLQLVTSIMQNLTAGKVETVTRIEFEWSPGQGDPIYTGDRSAFDVYVEFLTPTNTKGFFGIEVKYHENLIGKAATTTDRHYQISGQMDCFDEGFLKELEKQPLQQIWRDHMLAGIHKIQNKFDEGIFVFLYPEKNTHCLEAMEKYKRCLTSTDTFAEWTIESVANQVKQATDDDWIDLFTDRYLDFNKISDLNL